MNITTRTDNTAIRARLEKAGIVAVSANTTFTVTKADAKVSKTASFAYLLSNGAKDAREGAADTIRETWAANGQYRPLVRDMMTAGLVPKAAIPYIEGMLPQSGPISKDCFITFCRVVYRAIVASGKEAKGVKLVHLGIAERWAAKLTSAELDARKTVEG